MKSALSQKRGRIMLLSAAVAVIAVVFCAWPRGPHEPVYQGKTLTQWINEANDVGIFEQNEELSTAMTAFGTNAVPFLVHEFMRPISPWRQRLRKWADRHPGLKIPVRHGKYHMITMGHGLELLETNATPAMDVMVRCLADPERSVFAAAVLSNIGEPAIPHLIAGLQTTNALTVETAFHALRLLSNRFSTARTAIATGHQHPNELVRLSAVASWLDDVRDANPVPNLLGLTNDPSPRVVQAVTNQLAQLRQSKPQLFLASSSNTDGDLQTNAPPPHGQPAQIRAQP